MALVLFKPHSGSYPTVPDPTASLLMGASLLFTFPKELLLIIISHIVLRRDLLNLALTSKAFKCIIIPGFLELIHIRCDPRRIDIWEWLISKPHLARRIRTLELCDDDWDEYPAIIPSSFPPFCISGPEALETLAESFTAALMLMTRLHRFRWSRSLHSPEQLFIGLRQQMDLNELYFRYIAMDKPANFQVFSPVSLKKDLLTLHLSE